jgi:hypothetical protein
MDQTSWEAAENTIREWIKAGKIGGDIVPLKTIEEAVDLYLKDVTARGGGRSSADTSGLCACSRRFVDADEKGSTWRYLRRVCAEPHASHTRAMHTIRTR